MGYSIKKAVLKNGLTLFRVKIPSDDISILASVNAGSLFEANSNAGISHLIEHMLFKGTTKRLSRDFIYNEIGLLGGELFCQTNHSNIPLGLRVVLDDFKPALELISDLIFNSAMDADEIEKEKQIVLDEVRNIKDNPYFFLFENVFKLLFKGCVWERPIVGSINSINGLKPAQVQKFYNKMFNPANVVLFVVGPKSFEEVSKSVEEYFNSNRRPKSYSIPKIVLPRSKAKEVVIKKSLNNTHVMFGKVVPGSNHKDFYAINVLTSALSRSISNKILNQNAISYNSWAYYFPTKYTGVISIYATCDVKDYKKLKKTIQEEVLRYSKGEIPDEYIKDAVNSKIKSLVLKNATTMDKAKLLLDFWLGGNLNEVNTACKKYKSLTLNLIRSKAKKYLNPDGIACVSLGNLKCPV